MKHLFLAAAMLSFASAAHPQSFLGAFWRSVFLNKNTYKTKVPLTIKKVYRDGAPTIDQRDFTIIFETDPAVLATYAIIKTTVAIDNQGPIPAVAAGIAVPPGLAASAGYNMTTTTTETVPPTTRTVNTVVAAPGAAANTRVTNSNTSYSIPTEPNNINFIRYKIMYEEGDYAYIKLLPGLKFTQYRSAPGAIAIHPIPDTLITYADDPAPTPPVAAGLGNPSDYIFQVAKKQFTPANHYLASSSIIGKALTIPLRRRVEYWGGEKNAVLQASLNIGYAFGWKIKAGNNPYKSEYFNLVGYACGVSQQKHFSVERSKLTGKDSLSARTDELAVTYLAMGLTYEIDKFNIGLFVGKDKMFGRLKNWAFQDKWWWGIGIGYELFK